MTATKERIREFIVGNFYVADAGALEDDGSLLDQGIIDSTGVLELITFLESSFGISVDDAEILAENLDSVSRMASFVQRKQA
jgi:acyl carrier protein